MPKKKNTPTNWFQISTHKTARLHFYLVAAFAATTIIFDSWNLLTHEAIERRWIMSGTMLVLFTIIWFIARARFSSDLTHKVLAYIIIVIDIIFAGLNVYSQRGMASKSVMLFAIPLLVAASFRNRATLLATASLSTAAYSTAAAKYFYSNYGEGFRVELYGEIFFFSALFFIIAMLLYALVQPTASD